MPKSLFEELKVLADKNHFLDLSEEIRSILRQKWIASTNPELHQIKKLREGIENELKHKTSRKVQEEIARELDAIKQQLKKENE